MNIGILHPGEMGASVAHAFRQGGATVHWVSAGRSTATRERAQRIGLTEQPSLAPLCAACDIVVSVCPPQWAQEAALQVIALGYAGLYVDLNAISPERAHRIAASFESTSQFVDGCLIGPPAWQPATTVMYLSGSRAPEVLPWLQGGAIEGRVIDREPGAASALKLCDSAFNKGLLALMCDTLAASQALGVREPLQAHWAREPGSAAAQSLAGGKIARTARKAWRFAPEMQEIAESLRSAGLSGDFSHRAQLVYETLAALSSQPGAAAGEDEVVAALLARVRP